jgi:hypothetical protein
MKFAFIFLMIFLGGCVSVFNTGKDDSIIKEQTKIDSLNMEWHTYSSSFSATRNYITVRRNIRMDTLCVADNIADVKSDGIKFIIGFYGVPKLNMNEINVPTNIFGYTVTVDTTYVSDFKNK